MHRCVSHATHFVVAAFVSVSAHAQTHRSFAPQTLRGEMVVTQAPDVLVNGQPGRLSPGSRIRGDTNLLVMPGSIAGQKNNVHYTLSEDGQVKDVWILNPAELANKVWPRTLLESSTWAFEPGTQTWIRK